MKGHKPGRLNAAWKTALFILPLMFAFAALCIGRVSIPPSQVLRSIAGKLFSLAPLGANTERVIWSMRFPRVLLALLVGAGLSVSGCAFQSLFSNPLATPDTLGVASGASFGAALGILLGFGLVGMQLTALLFGFAAVALSYFSGTGRGVNSYILSGIMISSLFTALLSLVKYTADTESALPAITYWLMGDLGGKSYASLLLGAPLILLGLTALFLLRWRLNVLPLSEDEARSTGTNVRALRLAVILCAAAITAACVSLCGQVGWVGLLVPHICRMRFGANHLSLLPASLSLGGCFMLTVDTIARSVSAAEIPVSILTAIIGAPFFIFLMRRNGGWSL